MNGLTLFGIDQPLLTEEREEDSNLVEICRKKGLKGQVKRLGSGIRTNYIALSERELACIIEKKEMALLEIERGCDDHHYPGAFLINRIHGDGWRDDRKEYLWRRKKLANFKGNIPPEIIKKIPANMVKHAEVFYKPERDPIIAVKIKQKSFWKRLYLGIYQWD